MVAVDLNPYSIPNIQLVAPRRTFAGTCEKDLAIFEREYHSIRTLSLITSNASMASLPGLASIDYALQPCQ
ncbi:hypothetical protein ACFLUZ_06860 [Chloroflexota bacterium]